MPGPSLCHSALSSGLIMSLNLNSSTCGVSCWNHIHSDGFVPGTKLLQLCRETLPSSSVSIKVADFQNRACPWWDDVSVCFSERWTPEALCNPVALWLLKGELTTKKSKFWESASREPETPAERRKELRKFTSWSWPGSLLVTHLYLGEGFQFLQHVLPSQFLL